MAMTEAERGARALVRDIQADPVLEASVDRLVFERPASHAGLFIAAIKADIAREAKGDYSVVTFPRVRALVRKEIQDDAARLRAGMGFIGALITGLVSAGTAVYTSRLQIKAQEDIAEMQLRQKSAEAAALKAAAEARRAEAEAAMALAAQQSPEATAAAVFGPAGLPGWVLPVGIAAVVGTAIYFLFLRKG